MGFRDPGTKDALSLPKTLTLYHAQPLLQLLDAKITAGRERADPIHLVFVRRWTEARTQPPRSRQVQTTYLGVSPATAVLRSCYSLLLKPRTDASEGQLNIH